MKILVGFDGSNVSKEAVSLAQQHATTFKAEVIIAHSMVGGPEVPRKDFEIAENNIEHEKHRLLDNKSPVNRFYRFAGYKPVRIWLNWPKNIKLTKSLSACVGDQRSANCFSVPPLNM